MTTLTDADRAAIARARELAAPFDIAAARKRLDTTDTTVALAETLGQARHLLGELAAIIERLTKDDPECE